MKVVLNRDMFSTSRNPRVGNGWKYPKDNELGSCHRCGAVTTAYLTVFTNFKDVELLLCKGCLEEGINMINKEILNGLERKV